MTITKEQFTEVGVSKEMLDAFINQQTSGNENFKAEFNVLKDNEYEYVYEVGVEFNRNWIFHWFRVEVTAYHIFIMFQWTYSMATGKTTGASPRAIRHRQQVGNKIHRQYNKNFNS